MTTCAAADDELRLGTTGHLLESVTNPLGQQTTFTYDSKGNVLTATRLAGTPAAAATTTFTYDPLRSNVLSVTDPLTHTTAFGYNGSGSLETITDSEAHTTSFTNNTSGMPLTMSNALGHTSSFSYDGPDLGSVTDPRGGAAAMLFHDAAGRVRSVTDALNQRTLFPKINIKRLIRSAEPTISKMAEKTPLYTLPVPSTELDGEPRLCGETLQFQYQRDGIRVRGGIRFEHVAATRTRVERNSTVWHVEGAYDTLVEIVPSAWAEEIRAATQTRWRHHWELHHYLIYVDSAGSFEVLADSFSVLPEEVGSWPQD